MKFLVCFYIFIRIITVYIIFSILVDHYYYYGKRYLELQESKETLHLYIALNEFFIIIIFKTGNFVYIIDQRFRKVLYMGTI